MTTQALQKRLNQHCHAGTIKQNLKQDHNIETTNFFLYNNCIIITSISDQIKLPIYEALHILQSGPPSINNLIVLPDNCHSSHTYLVMSALSTPI